MPAQPGVLNYVPSFSLRSRRGRRNRHRIRPDCGRILVVIIGLVYGIGGKLKTAFQNVSDNLK